MTFPDEKTADQVASTEKKGNPPCHFCTMLNTDGSIFYVDIQDFSGPKSKSPTRRLHICEKCRPKLLRLLQEYTVTDRLKPPTGHTHKERGSKTPGKIDSGFLEAP